MAVCGMYDAETAELLAKRALRRAARKAKVEADKNSSQANSEQETKSMLFKTSTYEGGIGIVHIVTFGLGLLLGGIACTVATADS